jgi:soluble lytic murein transglycosylase
MSVVGRADGALLLRQTVIFRSRIVPRLYLLLFVLAATASPAADLAPQRAQFQSAWRLAQNGVDVTAQVPGLKDYPLYPYLPYERLRRIPDKAPFKEIEQFLRDYGDSMPGRRLRAQVLERYGRTGRHEEFLKLYVEELASIDLRCQAWTARRARKVAGDASAEALVVFDALDQDRSDCRPLLAHLRAAGELTQERVRARLETALAGAQIGLAQALSNELPKSQRPAIQRRILAHADPATALKQAIQWPANADSAMAASVALAKQARKGALAAEARYQTLALQLPFNAADRGRIEAEIARYAAVERLPEALRLLARVPAAAFDDNLREWQVRYHLRRLEYTEALAALEGMSPTLAAQSRWRYTHARVLELLDRAKEAGPLFAAAAGEANFHGFLAADRIGAAYAICPASSLLTTDLALAVLNLGGVQRALEWYTIGDIERARAEWFWQLPQLSPELRREAGLIASREGLHEWAIFTMSGETLIRQYEARFPLLHTQAVTQEAKRTGLPVHWVYGLIRAESAWNANARSPVGARGLMQLMPATAAAVAKSLGVRVDPLTDPAHNIRLGTTYLSRRVADLDGNAVLATGAYNAGIGAVKRWLTPPLPPWDLWVETVPYKETREYIARVLAFAVLYDWRIDGSPTRLSTLIPGLPTSAGPAPVACPTVVAGSP